ncbi:hypothetical protein ABPG75_008436 [Micractinium tetrahymenae]
MLDNGVCCTIASLTAAHTVVSSVQTLLPRQLTWGRPPRCCSLVLEPSASKYVAPQGAAGPLGPPAESKTYYSSGAAYQGFRCGFLVEYSTPSFRTAYPLLPGSSQIAQAHQEPTTNVFAAVGDPIGNEIVVAGGFMQRFTKGNIYFKAAAPDSAPAKPFIVDEVPSSPGRASILGTYNAWSGPPARWASLWQAINVQGPDSRTYTLHVVDFEKGVIVSYPPLAGAASSPLPWNSTQVFTSLSVFIQTLRVDGCDIPLGGGSGVQLCGKQDPYFTASLTGKKFSFPSSILLASARIHNTGNFVDTNNVTVNSDKGLVVPKVSSDLAVTLAIDAQDADVFVDSPLGTVVNKFDISNGWGVFSGLFNQRSGPPGHFSIPEYRMKRPIPVFGRRR